MTPAQTIRDYLQAQKRPLRKAKWIAAGVAMAGVFVLHGASHDVRVNCSAGAAGATVVIAFLMILRRLRCPICSQSLSKSCLEILYGEGLAACPHCGADYGQPMPQNPFR